MDDHAELVITSNKYGEFRALISKEDIEKVSKYNWCVRPQTGNCKTKMYYYPVCAKCKPYVLLHRYLLEPQKGMCVDHINHNTLDNRRENLRICTPRENKMNSETYITNKSGKTGVYWDDSLFTPKWLASIKTESNRIHIGYYDNYEEAVKAREKAEKEIYGSFAYGL